MYICRYPVEAPRPWRRAVWVPDRSDGRLAPGTLAEYVLHLPWHPRGTVWPVLDSKIDPSVAGLWVEMDRVPLAVPLLVEQQRRFDRDWRITEVFTPFSVRWPFSSKAHARVALAILARLGRFEAIARTATYACIFESSADDPLFMEEFAKATGLRRQYMNKLVAAAKAGRPLIDPKALRWILTEIAASDDTELAEMAAWHPTTGSADELLVEWVAPVLLGSGAPGWDEFRAALWLLGDSFHGTEAPFVGQDGMLAGFTAIRLCHQSR